MTTRLDYVAHKAFSMGCVSAARILENARNLRGLKLWAAFLLISTLIYFAPCQSTNAEDLVTYSILLKNHRFIPAEIHVPSGKPFFLEITNADETPDEFEMNAPPVEKVVVPGQQGRLRMRPLAPGRFKFFDDFHQDTAQGAFIAE